MSASDFPPYPYHVPPVSPPIMPWQQHQIQMVPSVADYAVMCTRIIDLETRIAALEAALDKLTGEK